VWISEKCFKHESGHMYYEHIYWPNISTWMIQRPKKAMKLSHRTWKICCSKHLSNCKELHIMLHHQQLTIIIVTTWMIKKNVKSWSCQCHWGCTNVLSMYTRLDAHLINAPHVCHKKEACLSMYMTCVQ
jgi:hypothetical protein